jgi:SAM-dependent methyltransferase
MSEGSSTPMAKRDFAPGVSDTRRPARFAAESPAEPAPPATYREKEFSKYILDLCDAGKHEAAAAYYTKNVSKLLESKLNPKEKLNHLLFLTRAIQAGAVMKHGYEKLLRKAEGLERVLKGVDVPRGGSFIELGCGAHDPLALATYYYLNGFEPVYGVDLLSPRSERYSAMSMYDICVNIRSFPRKYCRDGVEPRTILERLQHLAVLHFERGDFARGFGRAKDNIVLLNKDICQAGIAEGTCSLLASYAVLEHVSDIDAVCRAFFNIMKPGGIIFHFVDLADHRMYQSDGNFGPFSFLAEETAPPNMNRLRAPEMTEAHRKVGFEVLSDQRTTAEMPEEIRANLQPRFERFTIEEASAFKQLLLLRKPT